MDTLSVITEILSRIAHATAVLIRLKPVWNDRSISLSSKIRLMRSLTASKILYACESWTPTAKLQRRIQAMKMRCYRRILRISYKDHVTNEKVRAKIKQAIRPHENLLTTVKRWKLQWYGHVFCLLGLAKTILQGTVEGRRQSRDRKRGGRTSGNGNGWSSPSPREQWRTGKMEETACKIICGAPTTLAVKG